MSGCPMSASGAPSSRLEQTFHGGQRGGWMKAMFLPCRSPVGNSIRQAAIRPADHAHAARRSARTARCAVRQQVERAHRRHHEAAGHHRADHVVQVLPEHPGIEQQAPEAGQHDFAVRSRPRSPPGCCIQASVATMKKPESHDPAKTRNASEPVRRGAQPLFAKQEQAQETRFQEEREHAFHGQRLADHAAGGPGEPRPVRAELEFHGDAGHHAHGEVDGEDLAPRSARRDCSARCRCAAPWSSAPRSAAPAPWSTAERCSGR